MFQFNKGADVIPVMNMEYITSFSGIRERFVIFYFQ